MAVVVTSTAFREQLANINEMDARRELAQKICRSRTYVGDDFLSCMTRALSASNQSVTDVAIRNR